MTEIKLPERIQRKRTKGWRMPPNSKYVGPSGEWGSPFKVGDILGDVPALTVKKVGYEFFPISLSITKEMFMNLYRVWITDKINRSSNTLNLSDLASFDYLVCWCPLDQPCHVDILLELLASK